MTFTRRGFICAAVLSTILPYRAQPNPLVLKPIIEGLSHPWGMAFVSNELMLVTEREGKLRAVNLVKGEMSPPISGVPDIYAEGQGGLLDIVLAPDFKTSREVFLSMSEARDGGAATAVYRARLSEDFTRLNNGRVIFRQNIVARGGRHFGSRLVFDRSGYIFVTTGDRGNRSEDAQDPQSHIGKVLRITQNGTAAPDNPQKKGWAPEVWSIGHRNIQGAALHPQTGQLWTVEHGARGGDELNHPEAGKNYGWPFITFGRDYSGAKIGTGTKAEGMEQPVYYWDPSIAPSGMIFVTGARYPNWSGHILVGALAGEHIARLRLDKNRVVDEERLFEGFGRFRAITQSPDGIIYVLTDNARPYGGLYQIPFI